MRRAGIRAGQRFIGLTVLVISAGGLTSACGGAEQQASTELPSASSTSAEPTPELPPLGPADFPVPDEARVKDEAGAEAFLMYYIDLINRQQAIPDGGPLRDLGPDCRQCAVIAQRFDQAASAGLTIEGGQVTIVEGPGVSLRGATANLSFLAKASAATVIDAQGRPVPEEKQPAQDRLPSALKVSWSDAQVSWLASGLSFG